MWEEPNNSWKALRKNWGCWVFWSKSSSWHESCRRAIMWWSRFCAVDRWKYDVAICKNEEAFYWTVGIKEVCLIFCPSYITTNTSCLLIPNYVAEFFIFFKSPLAVASFRRESSFTLIELRWSISSLSLLLMKIATDFDFYCVRYCSPWL